MNVLKGGFFLLINKSEMQAAEITPAIVQKYIGECSAFEIKLGVGKIDDAAQNLLKFARVLDY